MKHTNFSADSNFQYQAETDLAAMAGARNYHHWVISFLGPHLSRGTILEVGAGIGTFAKYLLESGLINSDKLYLVEPSKNLVPKLKQNLRKFKLNQTQFLAGFLADNSAALRKYQFELVIYNNVFEHIKNDQAEIDFLFKFLKPGSVVFSFTPALPEFFSPFDQVLGHYRRYRLEELIEKFKLAGFDVKEAKYLDFWGAMIWLIKFKVIKSLSLSPALVKVYDTWFFPILAKLDLANFFQLGKNILVVVQKPIKLKTN